MQLKRRQFLSATAAAATMTAASPLLAENAPSPAPAPAAPNSAAAASYNAPSEIKKIGLINLRELEAMAKKVIPDGGFGYISSSAGDEWTKRENEAAFKRVSIEPHYLANLASADTTTRILGSKLSMPIIVTVMGSHGMAHTSAEAGTAKGADAAGTLFTTGSQSTLPMEEIAKASPGPKWFQLYLQNDRGLMRAILQRAKAADYKAVVLTLDAFFSSNRETDTRNHFHSPLPAGNYPGKAAGYGVAPFKTDLNWDDVAFVREASGLPVIIKGVLSPRLAKAAVEHGVAGVQVSTHGGRQLDDMPAAFTALPRVAEAIDGRIPIVFDSGIRRGQDVFKAVALGASVVAVGRPVMYGLALGGWMGVQEVLEHLNGELVMTMRLAGAASIKDISPDFLYA